jgi:uncharacterized membrane protein
MIREKMIQKGMGIDREFRLRGHEIQRIESLSDAVFAFAVTLLIVSLEVPKTFNELMDVMRGFVAFAISFFLLIMVWFHQFKFFRKYGLQDNLTIWLNVVLLFLILFFVYPLKFLFTLITAQFVGLSTDVRLADGTIEHAMSATQTPVLMTIYGLGFAAVFGIFGLLNYHAYRKRAELELSDFERFVTRTSIQESLISAAVALVSIGLAQILEPQLSGLAGYAYFLIGPALATHGTLRGRRLRRLQAQSVTT